VKLGLGFDDLPFLFMHQPMMEVAQGLLPKGSDAVSNSGLAA